MEARAIGKVKFPWGDLGHLSSMRSDGAKIWIVRWTRIARGPSTWSSVLNQAEIGRMRRFVREEDRMRFGVTRAMLRFLLGQNLGCSPKDIRLSVNRFGRPRIDSDQRSCLVFSVSHSGDYAVVGVTRQRPIGVDIEWIRPESTLADIAPSICSESELSEISSMAEADRALDMYRRWTVKEAYIKAIGLGLSYDPRNVRVTRVAETHEDQARRGRYELGVRGRWTLVLPEVAPGYCAAAVVLGSGRALEIARIE